MYLKAFEKVGMYVQAYDAYVHAFCVTCQPVGWSEVEFKVNKSEL